jgi:hypothetical protein
VKDRETRKAKIVYVTGAGLKTERLAKLIGFNLLGAGLKTERLAKLIGYKLFGAG